MSGQTTIVTYLLATSIALALRAAPPEFQTHAIADVKSASQVFPVDVNHDGKIDLVVLSGGAADLVWFENPGWQRHVIAGGLHGMINLAAWDTDGDGIPEIVLARDFSPHPKESRGVISLLKHSGDPRELWTITDIDRLPAAHRMRLADIDGTGQKVVVISPLAASDAEPPDYFGNVPLVFYRPGEWKRQVIDESNEGVVHGVAATDWEHNGRDALLIAGFTGVRLYRLGKKGRWTHTELLKGNPAPWPKSGASEIAVGHLSGERFLATIEPWHGNQVVVYRDHAKNWKREVIDDSLSYAHTLVTADFSGDGDDQIVAGCRNLPARVYIYDFDGKRWNRQMLDDGIAANNCAVADLNGDGKPDIACAGTATNNLKWYENLGPAKSAQR
jgi:Aldos-2-ulose dehydratase, beta-propeller domain/FG-GAP-like repeat